MRPIVIFEDSGFHGLLPLTYWRSVFGLRCGRKTMIDRIAHRLKCSIAGLWARDWMAAVVAERYMVPVNQPIATDTVLVNGRWLIDRALDFQPGPFLGMCGEQIAYISCDAALAARLSPADLLGPDRTKELLGSVKQGPVDATLIDHAWDLVGHNADALAADWQPDDRGMEGQVSSSAVLMDPNLICVGQGAVVEPLAVIDATHGPVYISENARVRPHACVTGPAYIGPGTVVNPHCHIYGGTTIGPMCKVGGEIAASIIAGYSNKQHDGFLGHSYVGSWVNLGAGTVNSNLKNTYGSVRVRTADGDVDTGRLMFGAVIADHAKTGIQQTLPTGASIGFAAMVSCSRVLPKFVPSFAWLTDDGLAAGDPQRLLETARKMMQRRRVTCTDAEARLFLETADRAAGFEASING